MELENQGGSGTASSHWEKRLVEVCLQQQRFLYKMNTVMPLCNVHDLTGNLKCICGTFRFILLLSCIHAFHQISCALHVAKHNLIQ